MSGKLKIWSDKFLFWLVLLFLSSLFSWIIFKYQNPSTERLPDRYYIGIKKLTEDDLSVKQNKILEGALKYIATKPKYKSKYYQTGYSNDKYGVCTDVVANALKNAGYDPMYLVNQDIKKNPDDYKIKNPDMNIDFRRVKNLKIYFDHTAIKLSRDIKKIMDWQGGDIVIFKNHIGIISDRRNKNGVPYVIHHSPWQFRYEENILEHRKDIIGHYRIIN